jgi:hypothetical protein
MVDGRRTDELPAYPLAQLDAVNTLLPAWNQQGAGLNRTQGLSLEKIVTFLRQAIGVPAIRHTSAATNLSLFDEVIVDGTSTVELTLPANTTGESGRISIYSPTAKIRIAQRSGQRIKFNDDESALGTTGYVESIEATAYLGLVSTGPNRWMVFGSNGNFFIQV